MAVRVAHGPRDNILPAIENGIIPKGTIIITEDEIDSELLFYDTDGTLSTITEKTRFASLTEAKNWVKTHNSIGLVFTIHNGRDWLPYIVQDDNNLSPLTDAVNVDITNVKRIDGGDSGGA